MTDGPIRVLLMEDNPGDARLLQVLLAEAAGTEFDLLCVVRLAEALEALESGPFDVALLDLNVPDSHGFETFERVRANAPDVPLIVLTGLDDAEIALRAVRKGAQDYLVKGQVDGASLIRSIQYAIERHRTQTAVKDQLLVDELTGLYNRRGFLTLAGQQLKMARRTRQDVAILYLDMDGLKQINDELGHSEGDAALKELAKVMRDTFRETDIMARLGGDEFASSHPEASPDDFEALLTRLRDLLDYRNQRSNRHYRLSLSVGSVIFHSDRPRRLEDLLTIADERMYEQKRLGRKLPVIV